MIDPAAAFERVLARGPFDDWTIVGYPWRWYLAEDGVLEIAPWRYDAMRRRFAEFRYAGPVLGGRPRRSPWTPCLPCAGAEPEEMGGGAGRPLQGAAALPLAQRERAGRSGTDQGGGRCDG